MKQVYLFVYCRYTLVRPCYKPTAVKLSRNTNEELKTHSKTYLRVSGTVKWVEFIVEFSELVGTQFRWISWVFLIYTQITVTNHEMQRNLQNYVQRNLCKKCLVAWPLHVIFFILVCRKLVRCWCHRTWRKHRLMEEKGSALKMMKLIRSKTLERLVGLVIYKKIIKLYDSHLSR